MLDLLKQDAHVGDSLNLYLTTGNSVRGTILEIGETFLLLEVDGVRRRYFPQLIGGWDVVNETSQMETPPKPTEQSADVEEQNNEESNEDDNNDILISIIFRAQMRKAVPRLLFTR